MAKRKEIVESEEVPSNVSFGFFKKEVEHDQEGAVRAIGGGEMIDPLPNKSGSYNLDYDLTIPFPEGRIIEIFGEEGTCKTTLTLEVAGRALQAGKTVLYINMEKNLNLSLMRTVRTLRPFIDKAIEQIEEGKKSDCPFWIVRASNGEQAFEAMKKFASMVPNGIAILDSIDAAQPSAVLSGEIGENKMGNLAKLISDAMRKLIDQSEANKVTLIFINQTRDKMSAYGDPTTTPGGKALGFYASQRIKLLKPGKEQIMTDSDGERIGVIIRYKIIKNKVAPDGNEGAFPILYKNGIFREQELVTQCCNFGIIPMGGKGGKQAYLPKLDRKTGEYVINKDGERESTCMSQFNAARRLLMDTTLANKLDQDLQGLINSGTNDPIIDLTTEFDEVSDTE